jgi:hypothetical protein
VSGPGNIRTPPVDRSRLSSLLWSSLCSALLVLLLANTVVAQSSQPKESRSAESAALVPLPPPLLRPPAGLELAPGSPGSLASYHLQRAASIQPLAFDLVLAATRRFEVGESRTLRPTKAACSEAEALRRLLEVTRQEWRAELKTGEALMGSVVSESPPVQVLRELAQLQGNQLRELDKKVRYIGRQTKRLRCRDAAFTGLSTVRVPEPRREIAGRALLVEATAPNRVLWLDGVPEAASGQTGWAVVILTRSGQVLCESDPRATSCREGRELGDAPSAFLALSPSSEL